MAPWIKTVLLILSILFLNINGASAAEAVGKHAITAINGIPYRYDITNIIDRFRLSEFDSITAEFDRSIIYKGTVSELANNAVTIEAEKSGFHVLTLKTKKGLFKLRVHSINGILSILPPLVAIAFALIFRQVVIALLAGVWLGSFIVTGYQPLGSVFRIVDYYVVGTLTSPGEGMDHVTIIVFTMLLGGMVGITSRMGGMHGIVGKVSRIATDARKGQIATWLMGIIIFFDDYTNTLIVGNSMRPLTDKLKVSREKLSYIVDSTAAPVTSLAVITSWIGFEVSMLDQTFKAVHLARNPLTTLISSIPFRFYSILTIIFVALVAVTGRDYSLMYRAELRARKTGKVSADDAMPLSSIDSKNIDIAEGITPRWVNGIVPIVVVVLVTFAGLIYTGRAALMEQGKEITFMSMLRQSDSFQALLWASFTGCITAGILALAQRLLSVTETITAWTNGMKSMFNAIIILILAWSIGKVCSEVHTADYLVHNLAGVLSIRLLPMLVFIISMGISFSTGTSWGTMSILIPIVIPLVLGMASKNGMALERIDGILLPSIAAILSGSVFGDHCSPISDTTIMSSMASSADHIDHVRTQLPYALTVGTISIIFGYLLTAFNVSPFISIAISVAVLAGFLYTFGKKTEGAS